MNETAEINNAEILNDLLDAGHCWWWDFIDDTEHGSKLRGTPYYSPSFLQMYGTAAHHLHRIVAKDDIRKVVGAIRCAAQPNSQPISDTIHVRTASGHDKLVEIFTRRLQLHTGEPILASMHSDLTLSNSQQWIDRTVLAQLQAFVSLKRWNPKTNTFVFSYVNTQLSHALGVRDIEVIGKCDADFTEDVTITQSYRRADEAVFSSSDRNAVLVKEEIFNEIGGSVMRLMTFRTQYLPPTGIREESQPQILQISFNVTSVTDLLRAVAEIPDTGIFIKDWDGRYQVVNRAFMQLAGVTKESDLIGRTFAEVAAAARPSLSGTPLESLLCENDNDVLANGRESISTATLAAGSQIIVNKRLIFAGSQREPHILGVLTPLFGDKGLTPTLHKIPQIVYIKRYRPDSQTTDAELSIVWANQRFHERHNRVETVGLTDYDLHSAADAAVIRRSDLKAIEVGRNLQLSPGWNQTSGERQWKMTIDALANAGCWEFREVERKPGCTSVLQTSKWAENIHGTWFVISVSSDVTSGDAEQRLYHDMTVHSIRNSILPVEIASERLAEWLRQPTLDPSCITMALGCLSDATSNVDWFLTHHLELLRMETRCVPISVSEVIQLISSELDAVQRSSRGTIAVSVHSPEILSGSANVAADLTFIRACFGELLRNAKKAVQRRLNTFENILKGHLTEGLARDIGWTSVSDTYAARIDVTVLLDARSLRIDICDNGAAAVNIKEREVLLERFAAAKQNPFDTKTLRLGLAFCLIVIEQRHGGELHLESGGMLTCFRVTLPLLESRND